MIPEISSSIKTEHLELHEALHRAMAIGGETGQAARAVAAVLAPHFENEEAYAMPPLGVLASLARDEAVPDVDAVLKLTSQLRAALPDMLAEHGKIRGALESLVATAQSERHPDIAEFAKRLAQHAKTEEEILYPAALLIGRYSENEAIELGVIELS